jgi:hypothetical protein
VKLGIFFALVAVAGCTAFYVGEFGTQQDRDFWIMVGLGLVTVSLLGCLALVGSFSPRLLLGVCTVTALACLAAALICLFTDHPKYAIVFGFWTVCCVGGFLILRRTVAPHRAGTPRPVPGCCPRCGGRLAPEDNECPQCRFGFSAL